MVVIKAVSGKIILDTRKEKTILISIKTNVGDFSASSASGKSTGKYEAKPYKKSIEDDIKKIKQLSEYFSEELIEKFDDLKKVEDIADRHIGANTIIAFESAILKAIASEKFGTSHSSAKNVERKKQKKDIWRLINPDAKKFPRLVGNCIGGGKHSSIERVSRTKSQDSSAKNVERKPDFQEFLLIPDVKSVKDAFEINKAKKRKVKEIILEEDKKFDGSKNDENAWMTSLNEKEVLEILNKTKLPVGLDIAASSFYKRKNYYYMNPKLKRDEKEQLEYVSNLIRNFNVFYIEDPFEENDFESFAELLKRFPDRLIVGDDLTTTNLERLKKAIKMKSINALIVKPNQIGSLIEVKEVCELAKKNNIKIVFSHRSGETEETILADLAFGFQADFFKCGITGKEREAKLKRLIEIERGLK